MAPMDGFDVHTQRQISDFLGVVGDAAIQTRRNHMGR